jgi:hypothetical protein
MQRLDFFHAEAIKVRKHYSYGCQVRELWFKDASGKECCIELWANFPIRRGNKLGLVYDTKLARYLAIVNFSTEQYFNFVPAVLGVTYDPFPDAWLFQKWFFRQRLTSPYGQETVTLNRSVEDLIKREVAAYSSARSSMS